MTIRACRVRKGRSLKRPNEVNAVLVRSLIRLSAVLWVAFALAGCGRSDGRSESYRYKLTLAVNTPNGVKRGSSIAEVTFFEVSIPARGIMFATPRIFSSLSGQYKRVTRNELS